MPIRIAPALILKPMLGLLFSMGLNAASHAEVYILSVPVLHSHANERAKVHQWVNLGQAEFPAGIRIPAYGISIQNPVEDGLLRSFTPCRATACTFGLKLNFAQCFFGQYFFGQSCVAYSGFFPSTTCMLSRSIALI